MKSIIVHPPKQPIRTEIRLAASKSECNRALIINALTGFQCALSNISEARDSQTMQRLLQSDDYTADVIDAGTTMRFLTAYFAVTNQKKRMTGTPRMCERPIGILVDALRILGADIEYEQNEGYPPLKLNGFTYSGTNELVMRGDVSSQYISALLLIAPELPDGLTIRLEGEVGSRPYIEMTLNQMAHFGIEYQADWQTNTLTIPPYKYQPQSYSIESDWSGASYWYSIVALATDAEVELLGLKKNSLQGDSAIAEIMRNLGVESVFTEGGVLLTKIPGAASIGWDFTNCPDLAQTIAVCCGLKDIKLSLTGIESLKIKETDRVLALQNELVKLGAELKEIEKDHLYEVSIIKNASLSELPSIHTYDDHRMAMAFAPAGMISPVRIEEPGVVVKSYPGFWKDLARITTLEEE
ncbi:3-phosphoshikimate 1-carboxyvinyltransferase [Dyadobacter sediminis]|uniref:3-phosphoshikimate 1-carboxyvinyltransferase n=1 Tax=Dyadobacter sediminis TaxID=1493691 RepID=A0A5R9KAP2_9BACT|nr:3-phosphoshikimate 1-carboxyvinyltransferase [Dyadobacter sediminis]TLU91819.1 3-phosphoshikimate 1-carboxyvinyltransferase [Dyadobacter sediminis]GGC00031.1 3-phosphoshikimate 1-carboxyvinyltransferase [Dyadobacter sediminis]